MISFMKFLKYILFSFLLSIAAIALKGAGHLEKVTEKTSVVVLFPNPVVNGEVMTVKTDKDIDKIELINIVGQHMKFENNILAANAKISFNGLTEGMYFLKILFVDKSSSTKRFWVK
jgi:hypothetical protein